MSLKSFVPALLLVAGIAWVQPAHAVFGIGGHYSFDFSVSMPDGLNDQLQFDALNMNGEGFGDAAWDALVFGPEDIPIYFDRKDFQRTPFSLGGKIYVDVIPFIDVIEIGGGLGCWEYDGMIRFPSNIDAPNPPGADTSLLSMIENNVVDVTYDTMDLTLKGNGIAFPGITGTPYIKLDLGLAIRKYIPIKPIEKVLRPYAGAGFDVSFATPVPSSGLIKDALGEQLDGEKNFTEIADVLANPENQKLVTQEIINRLFTPHMGMNIIAGFMVKPPVVPIGLYVDGKFMIPFGLLDEDAEVKGMGFKINTGLVLHFGKPKD